MQMKNERVNECGLYAAMKKAVELGVFPATANQETYLKNFSDLKQILNAYKIGEEL